MINYSDLKTCLHQIGNKYPGIIGIKKFLNFNSQVGISNISPSNDFCAKTQIALAQFQQSKGLSQTGRMNIETWRTIGGEMSVIQFETIFGASPNVRVLRNILFSNRLRRMFPTTTHKKLIEYCFKEGGNSEYGNGGGGLSAAEVDKIDYGSRLVDTLLGTGYDFPITLFISNAPMHAMTPEGMSVENAQREALIWIEKNTLEARGIQQDIDISRWEWSEKKKKTPELGYLERVPLPGEMSLTALTAFGKACHTYMDSVSPSHYGWQEYKIPKKTTTVAGRSGKIYEKELNDWRQYVVEMFAHSDKESGEPTQSEKDDAVLYMRGAFLTTFANKWFTRAVKDSGERENVYDFLRSKGLRWDQDLVPVNTDSPMPQQMPRIKQSFKMNGEIYA